MQKKDDEIESLKKALAQLQQQPSQINAPPPSGPPPSTSTVKPKDTRTGAERAETTTTVQSQLVKQFGEIYKLIKKNIATRGSSLERYYAANAAAPATLNNHLKSATQIFSSSFTFQQAFKRNPEVKERLQELANNLNTLIDENRDANVNLNMVNAKTYINNLLGVLNTKKVVRGQGTGRPQSSGPPKRNRGSGINSGRGSGALPRGGGTPLSTEEEKQLQTLKKEESVEELKESNPIVYYITKFIDAQLHLNYMRDFMIYNIIEEEVEVELRDKKYEKFDKRTAQITAREKIGTKAYQGITYAFNTLVFAGKRRAKAAKKERQVSRLYGKTSNHHQIQRAA